MQRRRADKRRFEWDDFSSKSSSRSMILLKHDLSRKQPFEITL